MADIIAYPLKPDGTADTSGIVVLEYSGDIADGGYYTTRHFRVPMKISGSNKQVAMFFKTIASQVIETGVNGSSDGRRFVTPLQKDVLSKLSIEDGNGDDPTQHLSINGVMQPSYYDLDAIEMNVNSLIDVVGDSGSGLVKDVDDLKAFFDGVDDMDATINKWHEIEDFLTNITESDTLTGLIANAVNGITGTVENGTGTTTFHKNTTFKKELKIDKTSTPGESAILTLFAKAGEGTQPTHTVYLTHNPSGVGSTSQTLNILLPKKSGTLATQAEVPYIGFEAPTNPKAGDIWFSA